MKTHTGFTLIEVLIAMLILAVGLLGLAALQTYTLRSNLAAYNYGQATQLLYDMSDRMRASSKTIDSTTGKIIDSTIISTYVIANSSTNLRTANKTTNNHDCLKVGTACTPAKLVEYDLIEWNNAIAGTLPMGFGTIALTNGIFTLSITWDDNRSGTVTSDDPTFTMSTQL